MSDIWITLGVLALACLISTWLDRRDHNREISKARYRLYRGFDVRH